MNRTTNIIKPNCAFTIYFTLMCCLYTNTYIQLMAQIGMILYIVIPVIRTKYIVISKFERSLLKFYLSWFGLFTLIVFLSQFWAYDVNPSSKTLISIFRTFVICFIIVWWSNSKNRIFSILLSYIIACAIMGFVAFITSFNALGTTEFGMAIGQHRNQIGAVSAPLSVVCYYLNKEFNYKYGIVLSLYFIFITFCTGSRSSIIQVALIIILILIFTSSGLSQKIRNLCIVLLVAFLGIVVIQNVPYLHEVVWLRIEDGMKTVLGVEIADASALGREYYKTIALMMFLSRPILGYGLDGFYCFLANNPYIMGDNARLGAVYSHCNYAEIAANFGLVGLVVWYIPIIHLMLKIFRTRKIMPWCNCLFAVFFSIVIFDYSRIPWETHLIMYLYIVIISQINCYADNKANNVKE